MLQEKVKVKILTKNTFVNYKLQLLQGCSGDIKNLFDNFGYSKKAFTFASLLEKATTRLSKVLGA
ncbi:MAG: hypothetical protein HOO91_07340 [Bacteroidales bacterium]|nr:hypothetical protein [Bacteroidales bacterium]